MKFNQWILELAAVAIIAFSPSAHADIYSTKALPFTNSPAYSGTNGFYGITSTNLTTLTATPAQLIINSDPLPVRQGAGLSLFDNFVGTNTTGSANVTNRFDVGYLQGGVTNWTTTHPIKFISGLNGVTTVIDWDLLDRTEIDNIAYIRWYDVTVAAESGKTNVVTIYPCAAGYSLYAP